MPESETNKLVANFSKEAFIEGFQKGDPRVIHLLYELHFIRLCDFCYYIVDDSHEAQDIVSDVFEKLLTVDRKNKILGKSFSDSNDIVNYLYVATRNRSFNLLEQKKRKRQINREISEKTYAIEEQLDFECHQGLADLKLLESVYNLHQRCIQVLKKLYFEDKSYEEIAVEMNISRNTVSNLRQQGITLLAKKLNKEDFMVKLSILLVFLFSCF